MKRRKLLRHFTLWALLSSGLPALAVTSPPRALTLLVLGDSLSAEYGLPRGSGWVALLEQRLAAQSIDAQVVNASISGETTSGGVSRLPRLLTAHRPSHVIVELGANDALRGLPLAGTRSNLSKMVREVKAAGAKALVIGMRVPPNYGRRYADDFAALFTRVAKDEGAGLVPFLLRGVADVPQAELLFQSDRLHPTAQAQSVMLDNVWVVLKPLLR